MTLSSQTLELVLAAVKKKDIKTAQRILNARQEEYADDPAFLFGKGMLEHLKGSDTRKIVLPLFDKAYQNGFQDDLRFLRIYGDFLVEASLYKEAVKMYGKILMIQKDDIEAHMLLASVFGKTGNPISAINVLSLAAKVNANSGNIRNIYRDLGRFLTESGYQKEAMEAYKEALKCSSMTPIDASCYLLALNYIDVNRKKQFEQHLKYRTIWENEAPKKRPPLPKTRKIKVGFVSGDFRLHSVSYFVTPLFVSYNKDIFEFHLFSTASKERFDATSQWFKNLTDKWHDIDRLNDRDAAKLIKDEQISVLVDLAGHTGGNRLGVFSMRPAPIQATWCGWPNTTGLKSIDYRITDKICEPDDAQDYHSEKLFKMDGCFLCYFPNPTMFLNCSFEDLRERTIVFGSFNNLAKMTPKTIKLWSKAVNAVPGSKLVIKHRLLNDPKLRDITLARFAENGLSADRIVIFDFNLDNREHMLQYNKIDIAFDSFPYNGTTTTCEALFMGVPVITILGDRHVSRVSASLLNAAGLGELVAKNEEDFVKIAADLAGNVQELTEIKQNLRNNMISSPLMSVKSFAQKWQNAILQMIEEVKGQAAGSEQ